MGRDLKLRAVLLAAALLAVPAAPGVAGGPDYHPRVDPAEFGDRVDHPYFPLVPGTTYQFVVKSKGHTRHEYVEVTRDQKVIMGVRCVVVRDRETENGAVREDTFDWYAQDRLGNVWYFGEATRETLANGHMTTEGSWEAGVKGAQPGIVMPANVAPGKPYRQEYLLGHAEDMAQIVAVGDSLRVPLQWFRGCVRTREWTRLESETETKWYARGMGLVRSQSSSGETAELVTVHTESPLDRISVPR